MNSASRLFMLAGALAGLLLVQACGRSLPNEEACNFVQNQNLQRVSWDKNLPVDLYIDNSVPAEYGSSIQAAVNRWNELGIRLRGREFFRLRSGSPGASTPQKDGYTKIYVMYDWESDKPAEQARTTVYWTGSVIYEADVRINRKNFDFDTTDAQDKSKVHLESLLVHEFGHVLGLAHTSESTSVMQVSLANGLLRNEPAKIDVDSLTCEY